MATRKVKHARALAKREAFLAEEKARGLEFQRKGREELAKRRKAKEAQRLAEEQTPVVSPFDSEGREKSAVTPDDEKEAFVLLKLSQLMTESLGYVPNPDEIAEFVLLETEEERQAWLQTSRETRDRLLAIHREILGMIPKKENA